MTWNLPQGEETGGTQMTTMNLEGGGRTLMITRRTEEEEKMIEVWEGGAEGTLKSDMMTAVSTEGEDRGHWTIVVMIDGGLGDPVGQKLTQMMT